MVAAAALTTCCLGNQTPAKAVDMPTFHAGYDYGFLYGFTSAACMNYKFGYISRVTLLKQLRATRDQDNMTPAIKKQIVRNFEKSEMNSLGQCTSAVRQVFGRNYQSADYWR